MLAYSILAPKTSTVHEYRRKAQGISVQELPLQAPDKAATDMLAHINGVSKWASDRSLAPGLMWPLFALSIVLLDSKTTPSIPVVLHVLNGDFDSSKACSRLQMVHPSVKSRRLHLRGCFSHLRGRH